jgi:hypothetical protein
MNRREVIVSGPAGDPMVREQLEALRADPAGAEERELDVRERESASFEVALHGKDGGLQARWDNLVGVTELWARIDSMPTRRRELRDRAAAGGQPSRTVFV